MHFIAEFKFIKYNHIGIIDSLVGRRWEARWSSPSKGGFKMNVNAAINTDARVEGIDAIVHSNHSEAKVALFKKFSIFFFFL